jgi:hypothetical protein
MGFLDALLGGRKKLKTGSSDRLFAMSTAAITLESQHGLTSTGRAAIVFQPLASGDFEQIVKEMEELVRGTGLETGTTLESSDDTFGYRWIVFSDPDIEDLVVAINAVNDGLQVGGYGDRTLCAMFAFERENGGRVYWIYNFKRTSWYPFVPAAGEQQRDNDAEVRLKVVMEREMPIEPELERWFPLWGTPI